MKIFLYTLPRIALIVFILICGFAFTSQKVEATVGGPIYIGNLSYNKADESVYYIKTSLGGRGCPPELFKISLLTGKIETVYSCAQGEKLLEAKGEYDAGLVRLEINKITEKFTSLYPTNLSENNIDIGIDFTRFEYLTSSEEIIRALFTGTIYQNKQKVTEFPVSGCHTKQPFLFEGYAIPGLSKKIILILSTKGDCWEGGYTFETPYVIGNLTDIQKRTVANTYKDASSALIPHEGTLLVFEGKDIEIATSTDAGTNTLPKKSNTILFAGLALIVGIALGKFIFKTPRITK